MPKLKENAPAPVTSGDLRPGSNTLMQLLSFVERHERLQEERDALGDDQKEIMAEAKGMGFDTKILRTVIRRRNMDAADRQEADAMLELYEDSVRQAEKQAVAGSIAEGSDPKPAPAAEIGTLTGGDRPPALKKLWGKKPAAETPPKQMDVEELAPSDNEVVAEAAREIAHAADHPDSSDVGKITSFLRRGK